MKKGRRRVPLPKPDERPAYERGVVEVQLHYGHSITTVKCPPLRDKRTGKVLRDENGSILEDRSKAAWDAGRVKVLTTTYGPGVVTVRKDIAAMLREQEQNRAQEEANFRGSRSGMIYPQRSDGANVKVKAVPNDYFETAWTNGPPTFAIGGG